MNVHQLSPPGNPGANASLSNETDLNAEVTVRSARAEGMGGITAEVETTRTQLTPSQELLGAVIGQAATDCRTALKRMAQGKFKPKDLPVAASACRFFLSESGHAMIHACGMGHEGVRAGVALAETTIRRLDLSRAALLCDPEESWVKVVTRDNLTHARAMAMPKVKQEFTPTFRLVA